MRSSFFTTAHQPYVHATMYCRMHVHLRGIQTQDSCMTNVANKLSTEYQFLISFVLLLAIDLHLMHACTVVWVLGAGTTIRGWEVHIQRNTVGMNV